jgi:hypothetical protein
MIHLGKISIIIYLLSASAAHAYVDPGSGSVIVTTVLGLLAAVSYTFRKYFYKLKGFISRDKSDTEPENKG